MTASKDSAARAPTPPPATSSTPPAGTPPAAAPVARSAEDELTAQAAADRPAAESLVGSWVPQLSSKSVGLTVSSVTFDDTAILADFQSLQTRYPNSLLVRSDDYRSFTRPGFWVTLVATPFDTADAWCAQQGFAQQDCYAKRLSHVDGPAGNTKPR